MSLIGLAGAHAATAQASPAPRSVSAATQISVPYPSFTSAFDNPGISDDSKTTARNLDGGGFSYSAQALAAAGLTSGAAITHNGLTFTWPNASPGTADNVVAGGQTPEMSSVGCSA